MSPYERGRADYKAGKTWNDNPYPRIKLVGSDWQQWRSGFMTALDEQRERSVL